MCYTSNLIGPKAQNTIHVNNYKVLKFYLNGYLYFLNANMAFLPSKHLCGQQNIRYVNNAIC